MAQVTVRYATALFELSLESGKLQEDIEVAAAIRDAVKESDVETILRAPKISASEKKALFEDLGLNSHLSGLIFLVIDKGRARYMAAILDEFTEMGKRHLGRARAVVISATALSQEQLERLTRTLAEKTGKEIIIEHKVDPSVIGGLYIQADGYYVDNTLNSRLRNLKNIVA